MVGRWAGFFAAFLFVSWPLVQRSTGMVMLEHLVTLFSLLAVLRFAKFFSTGSVRDGLLFGVMAVLAILTRGSAWSLGFVPVLVMVLTWRFQLLSRPALWVIR